MEGDVTRRSSTPTAEVTGAIPTLSTVALKRPHASDGRLLPGGATGTVVHSYRDGTAYEVEFSEPFHCVVTLARDDVEPV